jgi:hypothetical protein
MSVWNISSRWLCSLLLFCASAAIAQSTNGNASAGTAENSAVSDSSTSEGMLPEGVQAGISDVISASVGESSVSASAASVNSIAATEIRAIQSEGVRSYSTSATNSLQTGRIFASEKSELKAIQNSGPGAYRTVLSGNLPHAGGAAANVHKAATAGLYGTQPSVGVEDGTQPSVGVEDGAAYSEDFPDSTKGTAVLSPPDEGTQSALEWSPSIDFEFADMAEKQFLVPSLHVGLGSKKLSQREGKKRHRPGKTLPGSAPSSLLPSLPQETFESDVLGQSTLPSSLDQSSINPQ